MLVSQPQQESLVACYRADFGGLAYRYAARMSCGACVAAAAAVVVVAVVAVADYMTSLVVGLAGGGGDVRSMGSVANEVGQRMGPFRLLKAKGAERSGVNVDIEA